MDIVERLIEKYFGENPEKLRERINRIEGILEEQKRILQDIKRLLEVACGEKNIGRSGKSTRKR